MDARTQAWYERAKSFWAAVHHLYPDYFGEIPTILDDSKITFSTFQEWYESTQGQLARLLASTSHCNQTLIEIKEDNGNKITYFILCGDGLEFAIQYYDGRPGQNPRLITVEELVEAAHTQGLTEEHLIKIAQEGFDGYDDNMEIWLFGRLIKPEELPV